MRDKPSSCYSSNCPLAVLCDCGHHIDKHPDEMKCSDPSCYCREFHSKGKGFVLGSGDPRTAKLAIMLEGPGQEEISYSLFKRSDDGYFSSDINRQAEFELRTRDYPEMSPKFMREGVPVVGRSGGEIFYWVPAMKNISRGDVFIDNTLRCLPPVEKGGGDARYPKGNERKAAEGKCRQYDRWSYFLGQEGILSEGTGRVEDIYTFVIVSMHPAAILRDVTPLRLQAKNFEKAVLFNREGHRVLVLAGGKAAKMWLGYAENVTRWQGHFQRESEAVQKRRASRLAEWAATSIDKKSGRMKKAKNSKGTGTQEEKQARRVLKASMRKMDAVERDTGMEVAGLVTNRMKRKQKNVTGESNAAKMRKFAMCDDPLQPGYLAERAKEEGIT